MRRFLILAAAFIGTIHGADNECPYLNAATAAGVLNGAVKVSVSNSACDFTRVAEPPLWALRIEVENIGGPGEFAKRAAKCGSGDEVLKAIGNEAVACSYSGQKGEIAEQVMGRVRKQAFLVRVSTTDTSAARADLRDKARKVAEQVAGFLF